MNEPITLSAFETRVASDLAHAVLRSRQNVGTYMKDIAASLAKIIEGKADPGKHFEEIGNDFAQGVWFKSRATEKYYRQPHNCLPAGILCVIVNGVIYRN